jgi:hypothetical protein
MYSARVVGEKSLLLKKRDLTFADFLAGLQHETFLGSQRFHSPTGGASSDPREGPGTLDMLTDSRAGMAACGISGTKPYRQGAMLILSHDIDTSRDTTSRRATRVGCRTPSHSERAFVHANTKSKWWTGGDDRSRTEVSGLFSASCDERCSCGPSGCSSRPQPEQEPRSTAVHVSKERLEAGSA